MAINKFGLRLPNPTGGGLSNTSGSVYNGGLNSGLSINAPAIPQQNKNTFGLTIPTPTAKVNTGLNVNGSSLKTNFVTPSSTSATNTNPVVNTPAAQSYIKSKTTENPPASGVATVTGVTPFDATPNPYNPENGVRPDSTGNNSNSTTSTTSNTPSTPTSFDTQKANYSAAYQDYINTLNPSAETTKAQQAYNDYVSNAKLGVSNLEGQGRGIPLSLVRGQQAKLTSQAQIEADRLQKDIGVSQGNDTAKQNAGLANVSLQEKLLGLEKNPNDPKSNLPASAQEYEYAKANGYTGTFSDYQNEDANRKASTSTTTVDPNTLQGMLNVYKATGVLPALGMGNSPLRAQFYAALGGADGSTIVNDAQTTKAVRAGLTTAYKTQQNQLAANKTSIGTLDKQLELAKGYSDQVSRSDSPLVNKYLIAAKTGVFGDPQTTALNNIVTTAAYEFAKILSGASASVAGVSVSSGEDAKNLLNSAMSKGQFNEVLGLMKKEAQYRLDSQNTTLKQLESDMTNLNTSDTSSSSSTSSSSTNNSIFDF